MPFSLFPLFSPLLDEESRSQVIRLRCTRLQHRTCKTSRGNFTSYGLGTHGFSTERARLAGDTSPRSWFHKKCLLPMAVLGTNAFRLIRQRFIGALRFARGFKNQCIQDALRLTGALRFARGFKKVPPTYWDFDFFFDKIPQILKLEVGFFST